MKWTVLGFLAAASIVFGQGIQQPKRLPPEIGQATITVTGISGTMATLTTEDLAKLPQQTVKTTNHGTPVTFEGVLLNDVLAKVALPAGEAYNSQAASYYLTVEANDGYKAIFSWAEIDPSFTDRKVYVVTVRDGKLLPDKDGPFELIVPGEKRNSRWVRQLKALTIRRAD
jgi:hypothetical protein